MKHKFLILSCCLFCLACTKESKVQEVQETVMHITTEDIILCDDNTLELGITETDFAIDCNLQHRGLRTIFEYLAV